MPSPSGTTESPDITTTDLSVVPPFRLDLTLSALRRLPTNMVDVYTADGRYLRALAGGRNPVVVRATQPVPDRLTVTVHAPERSAPAALATVRRMLGVEREVAEFHGEASKIPWLAPLAGRMRGLKPPRYPTLFESCLNAVLFQQVSLHAASAILGRLIVALGARVEHDGTPLMVFPTLERFLETDDAAIRGFGVSTGKVATLRRLAEAIAAGELNEAELEGLPSAEISRVLCSYKGVGPWTAAVILLRGMGRLDAFPGNDSGVAANLKLVAGEATDTGQVLKSLGSQRGMLYFNLLLARLEARGEIGYPSIVVS